MKEIYEWAARIYFVVATVALFLLAVLLLVLAFWDIVAASYAQDFASSVLDSIGLIIIGFAVVETAKFIAEEEILRKRELRSPRESRRSLTKFVTIIVIAASLEALVMVFKSSRTNIADSIYATGLLMSAVVALVALGAYQWLSSRIDPSESDK